MPWPIPHRFSPIFQKAIRCHEICCRLVKIVDRIASFFFGTLLIMAVPVFAISVSNLVNSSREDPSWRLTLISLFYLTCAVTVVMLLASAVHEGVSFLQFFVYVLSCSHVGVSRRGLRGSRLTLTTRGSEGILLRPFKLSNTDACNQRRS